LNGDLFVENIWFRELESVTDWFLGYLMLFQLQRLHYIK